MLSGSEREWPHLHGYLATAPSVTGQQRGASWDFYTVTSLPVRAAPLFRTGLICHHGNRGVNPTSELYLVHHREVKHTGIILGTLGTF